MVGLAKSETGIWKYEAELRGRLCVFIVPDVFGECYSNSEDRAYALLVRRTHCWSKSTVLNLATEADAKSFFAHDGVQVTIHLLFWRSPIALSLVIVYTESNPPIDAD